MVVQNISGTDLSIPEIRSVVPADGKKYILPYEIAIRYKQYLKPVQLSDTPFTPAQPSTDPISKQIQEMNQNAVTNLQSLQGELVQEETVAEEWGNLTKYERVKSVYENNPEYTLKKIAQFAGVPYSYAQRTIKKLKAEEEKDNAEN